MTLIGFVGKMCTTHKIDDLSKIIFLVCFFFQKYKKKEKKIFLQTNFYANGIKVLYGGLTTQRRKLRHLKFFLTYGDFIKRTRLNLL